MPVVRSLVARVDPAAGIDAMLPMEQLVASSLTRQRFYALMLGVFAAIAAALGAIGTYGVLAYAVARARTRSASAWRSARNVATCCDWCFAAASSSLSIGIVLGLAGAAGLSRFLSGLLYGLTPLDPATYAAVALLFAAVALVASYLPARRASQVDPMVALRGD